MNVILFKQIIQNFWVEDLPEEIILCFITAGMVLTITEIWKAFVQKDLSRNIETAIQEAKPKNTESESLQSQGQKSGCFQNKERIH